MLPSQSVTQVAYKDKHRHLHQLSHSTTRTYSFAKQSHASSPQQSARCQAAQLICTGNARQIPQFAYSSYKEMDIRISLPRSETSLPNCLCNAHTTRSVVYSGALTLFKQNHINHALGANSTDLRQSVHSALSATTACLAGIVNWQSSNGTAHLRVAKTGRVNCHLTKCSRTLCYAAVNSTAQFTDEHLETTRISTLSCWCQQNKCVQNSQLSRHKRQSAGAPQDTGTIRGAHLIWTANISLDGCYFEQHSW